MVIVKLIGGLGNQLFQYAAGYCLAERHKTLLKLDASHLNTDPQGAFTKREFELNIFKLEPVFATGAETSPFLKKSSSRISRTVARKLPGLFTKLYIAESGNAYHKKFSTYPADTYLDGFWQSEHYFKPVEDSIRKEFIFRNPATGANEELIRKITQVNAVSLHVRRADYVNNKQVNNYLGTCSVDYYQKAVNLLQEKCGPVELFIFSDDIPWCRENLQWELPHTYIEHNSGKNSWEDMRLMSHCKHNIIANSSFSWWGAWLNNNKAKLVVAPQKWFRSVENPDIYPTGWIKL